MSSRPYREKLINEVKKCPVLYDTRDENHRDINARDRCWQEISTKLGVHCEILKREWKILRDSMRQALKRSRNTNAATSARALGKKWRFQSQMAFLLPYMTRRNQRQLQDVKMDESAEPEQSEQEQEADAWDHENVGDDDSMDLFFASICQSAKRLPRHLQNQVKRQVMDVVLRIEDEYNAEDSKAELNKNYTQASM
ncbi:transcription factor Adf-1 [Amyelois transitella]|uniref:transcription factor Adf-1 n=1 Tax=Amyelois transitella TaxID=680683 RepID=UPI00067B7DD3|nr:transcription factor Adf-1 [Amyelois transitella]XP_013196546.1 transcription factor Adf-1 [Amyelois transitella]